MQANPVLKSPTPQSGYQASVPVTVYRELAAELQSTQAKLSFFQLQNEQLTRQNQMLLQEFEAIAQSTDRVQAILSQSNLPESKLSGVLAGIRAAAPARNNPQPQSRPPAKQRTADKPATANPRRTAVQQTNHAIQEAISRAKQLATEATPQSSPHTQNQAPHFADATMAGESLYYESSFIGFDEPMTSQATKTLPKLEIREEISSRPLRTDNSNKEDASEAGLSGWVLMLTITAIILTSFGAGYLLMRPFVK